MNIEEFGTRDFLNIDRLSLLLFYTQTISSSNDDLEVPEYTLDPDGDNELLSLFADPYHFESRISLRDHQRLTLRHKLELRRFPDQEACRSLAAARLSPEQAESLYFFAYLLPSANAAFARRDADGRRQRKRTPFAFVNEPDRQAVSVVLFKQYSFEPVSRCMPVWHYSKTPTSRVGLIGVQRQALRE